MTYENTQQPTNTPAEPTANTNRPDWIVKAPRGQGRNSFLERIGGAWNREDGGIGIRLAGKQIIEDDIYLYPNEPQA